MWTRLLEERRSLMREYQIYSYVGPHNDGGVTRQLKDLDRG